MICVGHGHRYLTVVLDLDRGAIVFVGQGNGADALMPFWKRQAGGGAVHEQLDRAGRRVRGIRILQQFAVTLAAHRNGILAWNDCQITTAPLECTNTKIRVLQHQAYGYREQKFFRLKLYALHDTTYALVG